jgi:hypothetical protein
VRAYIGYDDSNVVRYNADDGWGAEPVYSIDLVGIVNTTARRYAIGLVGATDRLSKYDGALTPATSAEYSLRKQLRFDSDVNMSFSLVVT